MQRDDGSGGELDLIMTGEGDHVLILEIKKRKEKISAKAVSSFSEKVELYRKQHPDYKLSAGILSLGGFSAEAKEICAANGIGTATALNHYQKEWRIS